MLTLGQTREAHCKSGGRTAALSPPRTYHDLISGGEIAIDPTNVAVKANKESAGTGRDVISSLDATADETSALRLWPAAKPDRLQLQRNCSRITTLHQGRIPIRLAQSR